MKLIFSPTPKWEKVSLPGWIDANEFTCPLSRRGRFNKTLRRPLVFGNHRNAVKCCKWYKMNKRV